MFTSKLLLYFYFYYSILIFCRFYFVKVNIHGLFPSTAAATFRQAVALIFDQVVSAESLPMPKYGSSSQTARTGSVAGDLSQNINNSEYVSSDQFCLTYSFIFFFFLHCFYCADISFCFCGILVIFIISEECNHYMLICAFPDKMKDIGFPYRTHALFSWNLWYLVLQ